MLCVIEKPMVGALFDMEFVTYKKGVRGDSVAT